MAVPAYSVFNDAALLHGKPSLVRACSEIDNGIADLDDLAAVQRLRHKSTSMNVNLARLSVPSDSRPRSFSRRLADGRVHGKHMANSSPIQISPGGGYRLASDTMSPPTTPTKPNIKADVEPNMLTYDFSKVDYELERARKLGSGLWSDVYLAETTSPSPVLSGQDLPTPPATPRICQISGAGVYAVKVAARKDALAVFKQEAKILTAIQREDRASQYIVPFYGQDPRNSALVFKAVIGGSMEDLVKRLSHMTEVSRHLEVVAIWPRLAHDLIAGLDFIHEADIIHADIKPANILLDISDHYTLPSPVIRARYIDFSAAFVCGRPEDASNAGGTYTFMAPEQMRIQKDLSTPTYASDVWSLGISLLSVIILGSPYAAACGDNAFMLREAIKSGDPMGFARMDPVAQKRMQACQDFIDCCKLALLKDRERRVTAAGWKEWLETKQIVAYVAL
jgi:serine/threonine protein kinase